MDGKLMNREGFVQKYETICRDIWLGKIKNGWKAVYNKLIGFFQNNYFVQENGKYLH